MAHLHAAGHARRQQPGTTFGDVLRTALRTRGLTLERACWHLAQRGVRLGRSSLSDWQQGRCLPTSGKSRRAVDALEEILELPPGRLLGLLGTSRPRAGRRTGTAHNPLDELLRDVADTRSGLQVLSRSRTLHVGSDRRVSVTNSHTVVRARRDGVDRFLAQYVSGPGCLVDRLTFARLDNCRLGRVVRRQHPRTPALVAELLFDRPLAAGDTWIFGLETVNHTGGWCTDVGFGFREPVGLSVLRVNFDPAVEPLDLHCFVSGGLDARRVRLRDLTLGSQRTVHITASDVRAGIHGIAWSWA